MTEAMKKEEVARIRADAGLSAKGLADLLGLGEWGGRTVRRWEAGDIEVRGATAFALRAIDEGYRPKEGKADE